MSPFILSQLPVLMMLVPLCIELCGRRRYALMALALLFMLVIEHTFIVSAHIIVYSQPLYAFSRWVVSLTAVCIVPLFYWMANYAAGRHRPVKSLLVLFAPACLLFLDALNINVGRDNAELIVVCQSILLIGSTWIDYRLLKADEHLTRMVNDLMNYGGLLGFTFTIQASVGIGNWINVKDYALLFSCLDSFVVSYIFFLLKKMVVAADTALQQPVETKQMPVVHIDELNAPAIDYAASPEIPRDDDPASGIVIRPNPEPTQREIAINNLKNLIERDKIYLRAGLRIDEVAVMLGTNRTYIAKMMKEVYGCPFTEYMNLCRLKSAQNDMLTRKNASIETIALANGFNSSNTFNKVFNQHFGCAPAAWRREALDK